MDLKDFIKSTLMQIVQAVEESNAELVNSKAVISPKGRYHGTENYITENDNGTIADAELIDFDLAVTAREETGISILSSSSGAEHNKEQENTTVSRIRFKIPVLLPKHSVNRVVESKQTDSRFFQ